MEETVHDLIEKIRQRKKSITTYDKEDFYGYLNFKTSRHYIMYTLFYSDISEFAGDLKGMLDEGTCKTSIRNMHKIGWKESYFNSSDVSMLGHSCGVWQYPQFYDRTKNISNVTTSICGNISRLKGSSFSKIKFDYCISKIS